MFGREASGEFLCSAAWTTKGLWNFGLYNNTARVAVRFVLLYEAKMLAEAGKRTMDVFTVKVALVAPEGTVTLEGALATERLLESVA
jgi:hypothetical protein